MSAGSWEKNRQFLSIDPYGDWALGDGRDFLTTFFYAPTYKNFPLVVELTEEKHGGLGQIEAKVADPQSASFVRFGDPEFLNSLERLKLEDGTETSEAFINDTTKFDLEDADLNRIRSEAAENDLSSDEFSGNEKDNIERVESVGPPPAPESFVFPVPIKSDGIVREYQPNLESSYIIPSSLDREGANPVIVGVIDDAANVTLPKFSSNEHGSRVDFLWVQEGRESGEPFDQFFGREYDRKEIEAATLAEYPILELGLNEVLHTEHLNGLKTSSHGSAVLDIAAGYKDEAQPDNQRIISVQLPTAANWDGSGSSVGWLAAIGVTYILKRAHIIASTLRKNNSVKEPVPVVINLSYGIAGGAHDGTGVFEGLIDREIDKFQSEENDGFLGPISVVIAAGNDFVKRRHASVERNDVDGTNELDVSWRISPGDRSSSFLELWFDTPERNELIVGKHETFTVDLTLQPPTGERLVKQLKFSTRGLQAYSLRTNGKTVATVYWEKKPKTRSQKTQKARILIAVAPTETSALHVKRHPAAAGTWNVNVKAASSRIDAWVQREEGSFNDPVRGAGTYLEDREYQRFTYTGDRNEVDTSASSVQRFGTLNGAATGKNSLVVGAYRNADGKALQESSAANNRIYETVFERNKDNVTAKSFFAASADSSRILRGIQAATNGAGSATIALTGTSAAAPQVTRLIAQYHSRNPGKSAAEVKNYLEKKAVCDEATRQNTNAWSPPLPESPEHDQPEQQPPIDKLRAGSGRLFSTVDLGKQIGRLRHT